MLAGQSILCFAPDPWNDIWRNRHQIMSRLAQQNQVLYVEPRPYFRQVAQEIRSGSCDLTDLCGQLREVSPGLSVYRVPRYAPLSGRQPLKGCLDVLRAFGLERAMRRLNMDRPILWLFRPDMADVPGRYNERLLIYHIVDEYLGYSDTSSERAAEIKAREQILIRRADLVLVTSKALLERKQGINPHTYWVPNGVDYARFADAVENRQMPQELSGLPRPRIGYVGAINDKIDTDLLLGVSEAFSDGSLILVGPERPVSGEMRQGLDALRLRPNVCFVGRVPVEQVPHYMAVCDVGLLPYKRNAWTENIHPLKMYEYLACGLPVVAMDIPSVHEEAQLIRIADNLADFVRGIRAALEEGNALRATRQARAAENTWQQRVEQISTLIERVQ